MPKCPHCPADYSTEEEVERHLGQVGGHVRDRLLKLRDNWRSRARFADHEIGAVLRQAADELAAVVDPKPVSGRTAR